MNSVQLKSYGPWCRNGAKRAVLATKSSSLQDALMWAIQHSSDADFDNLVVVPSSNSSGGQAGQGWILPNDFMHSSAVSVSAECVSAALNVLLELKGRYESMAASLPPAVASTSFGANFMAPTSPDRKLDQSKSAVDFVEAASDSLDDSVMEGAEDLESSHSEENDLVEELHEVDEALKAIQVLTTSVDKTKGTEIVSTQAAKQDTDHKSEGSFSQRFTDEELNEMDKWPDDDLEIDDEDEDEYPEEAEVQVGSSENEDAGLDLMEHFVMPVSTANTASIVAVMDGIYDQYSQSVRSHLPESTLNETINEELVALQTAEQELQEEVPPSGIEETGDPNPEPAAKGSWIDPLSEIDAESDDADGDDSAVQDVPAGSKQILDVRSSFQQAAQVADAQVADAQVADAQVADAHVNSEPTLASSMAATVSMVEVSAGTASGPSASSASSVKRMRQITQITNLLASVGGFVDETQTQSSEESSTNWSSLAIVIADMEKLAGARTSGSSDGKSSSIRLLMPLLELIVSIIGHPDSEAVAAMFALVEALPPIAAQLVSDQLGYLLDDSVGHFGNDADKERPIDSIKWYTYSLRLAISWNIFRHSTDREVQNVARTGDSKVSKCTKIMSELLRQSPIQLSKEFTSNCHEYLHNQSVR
jgi:hypothetical protein